MGARTRMSRFNWANGLQIPLIFLMLLACGCGKPYRVYTPEPLTMQQRAQLGKIAVLVGEGGPAVPIEAPKARVGPGAVGAVVGGGAGAGAAALIAAPAGPWGWPAVFVAVAPFTIIGGAMGGAAGGASLGYTFRDDELAAKAIKGRVSPDGFNPYVQGEALAWGRSQSQYVLAETGPAPASKARAERAWLADRGFGSSLKLQITHTGLRIVKARQAVVFVALQTRVEDAKTGRVQYESFLEYTSPPREFNEWKTDNAQPVLAEIEKGTTELVRLSMYELFERTSKKAVAKADTGAW